MENIQRVVGALEECVNAHEDIEVELRSSTLEDKVFVDLLKQEAMAAAKFIALYAELIKGGASLCEEDLMRSLCREVERQLGQSYLRVLQIHPF